MMCNSIVANIQTMFTTFSNVVYSTITLFSIENQELYSCHVMLERDSTIHFFLGLFSYSFEFNLRLSLKSVMMHASKIEKVDFQSMPRHQRKFVRVAYWYYLYLSVIIRLIRFKIHEICQWNLRARAVPYNRRAENAETCDLSMVKSGTMMTLSEKNTCQQIPIISNYSRGIGVLS